MSMLFKGTNSKIFQSCIRKLNNICIINKNYNMVVLRLYCDETNKNRPGLVKDKRNQSNNNMNNLTEASLSSKYDIFKESDAPVLLDVYEEKIQLENEALNNIIDDDQSEFQSLSLKRGIQGVYDIEDLIDLLRRDKARDIFVATLPPQANYVDYIVIVTGRSRKHMSALANIVRRVYKKKRLPSDVIPRIEGENSTDWMALDLGNIALHIFSYDARNVYDLESLWSLGSEYDPLINAPEDSLISLLKKHEITLTDVSSKGELL